jgi:hypothetical protein
MLRYKIIASNRYADTYIVTAENEEQALEAVYDEDAFPGVEVDHVNTDCVGSDIYECELIEEEDNAEALG